MLRLDFADMWPASVPREVQHPGFFSKAELGSIMDAVHEAHGESMNKYEDLDARLHAAYREKLRRENKPSVGKKLVIVGVIVLGVMTIWQYSRLVGTVEGDMDPRSRGVHLAEDWNERRMMIRGADDATDHPRQTAQRIVTPTKETSIQTPTKAPTDQHGYGRIHKLLHSSESDRCSKTHVLKGEIANEPDVHVCLDAIPTNGCVVYSIGIANN